MLSENINEETTLVSVEKKNSINYCQRCGNEFKKRLLLFNTKKECFICGKNVCSDCLSKEERIEPYSNKKGYVCLDCYPKTRVPYASSFLPGVMDINAAVDSIESVIPAQIENVSAKLDEISSVREVLEGFTGKLDEITNVKEVLENLTIKLDEITKIRIVLEDLLKLIKFEVEDVKSFTQLFTHRNWKMIKKDIYLMIIIIGIGIFILSGILTVQILFILKYFN